MNLIEIILLSLSFCIVVGVLAEIVIKMNWITDQYSLQVRVQIELKKYFDLVDGKFQNQERYINPDKERQLTLERVDEYLEYLKVDYLDLNKEFTDLIIRRRNIQISNRERFKR
jgi:hypothetical protein